MEKGFTLLRFATTHVTHFLPPAETEKKFSAFLFTENFFFLPFSNL
jgi:hypothetical protein